MFLSNSILAVWRIPYPATLISEEPACSLNSLFRSPDYNFLILIVLTNPSAPRFPSTFVLWGRWGQINLY